MSSALNPSATVFVPSTKPEAHLDYESLREDASISLAADDYEMIESRNELQVDVFLYDIMATETEEFFDNFLEDQTSCLRSYAVQSEKNTAEILRKIIEYFSEHRCPRVAASLCLKHPQSREWLSAYLLSKINDFRKRLQDQWRITEDDLILLRFVATFLAEMQPGSFTKATDLEEALTKNICLISTEIMFLSNDFVSFAIDILSTTRRVILCVLPKISLVRIGEIFKRIMRTDLQAEEQRRLHKLGEFFDPHSFSAYHD